MARPSSFTAALADEICERIAEGEALIAICRESAMPSQSMVYRWLDQDTAFRENYTRARLKQADFYAEQIIEIADDSGNDTITTDDGEKANSEWIARSRLRVDARKWVMSKLAPKKYGDKLDVTSGGEAIAMTPEERAAKIAALTGLAARRRADAEDGSDLL